MASQSTSSVLSETVCCSLCSKQLSSGDRRTLNPNAGDVNRRVVECLSTFVFEEPLPQFGPKCYVCRSCFNDGSKVERMIQSAQYTINHIRKNTGSNDIRLVASESQECDIAITSTSKANDPVPSTSSTPPKKRARRNIFTEGTSPIVQVCFGIVKCVYSAKLLSYMYVIIQLF